MTTEDADGLELERAAFDVHEAVMTFLAERFKGANALAILTALTYEVGRQAGRIAEHTNLTAEDERAMLDGIREVMHFHLQAYRRGLRQ